MMRKVVRHGVSTLTISLPTKWVKKHGIKAGDEILIAEKPAALELKVGKNEEKVSDDVDVDSCMRVIKREITCHFRKGYDELTINFDSPQALQVIESMLANEVVGYEIIKQGLSYVVIRDIAGSKDDFNVVIDRVWSLLFSMSEDTYSGIKEKDKVRLKNIDLIDTRVNKFTNFCARLLNKVGIEKPSNIPTYYNFLRSLEQMGDIYKMIASYYSRETSKSNPECLASLKEVNELFKEFHSLYCKLDIERLDKLFTALRNASDSFAKKIEEKKENIVMNHYLFMLCVRLRQVASALLELQI